MHTEEHERVAKKPTVRAQGTERFEFGRNWASFNQHVTQRHLDESARTLLSLLGLDSLDGLSFLDLGCGSGIHSLAAIRAGVRDLLAVDADKDSVDATRDLLRRFAPTASSEVCYGNALAPSSKMRRGFDVVYSWGVLHHTGDLRRALEASAKLVSASGYFVFALYRRTWLCPLWKTEKRWYLNASPSAQERARKLYRAAVHLGLWATGQTFSQYVDEYRNKRGMDYEHDVHDWLGGYPYESISPSEVDELMRGLGFTPVRAVLHSGVFAASGFLGSRCNEYVYKKNIDFE